MDEYSVDLTGRDLDLDRLRAVLPDLRVTRHHRKGSLASERDGRPQLNRNGRPWEDSSITLAYDGDRLLPFLGYLADRLTGLTDLGIEEIEVRGLLERDAEQINGELSAPEIAKLADLKACFCFSIIPKQ